MKKIILIFILLTGQAAFATGPLHRYAMIQDGMVQNVALWDQVTPWNPVGYALVDVTSLPQVDNGCTCIKCDGSDFVNPN